MNLVIEQAFAQKLVNYLATKPFIEVAEFIPVILQLKPISEPVVEPAVDAKPE